MHSLTQSVGLEINIPFQHKKTGYIRDRVLVGDLGSVHQIKDGQ